jgi:predicted Zn-dependent protease
MGNFQSAREALDTAQRLAPGVPFTMATRGFIEGRAGNRNGADECLGRLRVLSETCSVRDLFFAWVYLGMDERDRGVGYLQRAVNAADPHALYLNVFFVYDSLREHPEFARLLKQLGLDG